MLPSAVHGQTSFFSRRWNMQPETGTFAGGLLPTSVIHILCRYVHKISLVVSYAIVVYGMKLFDFKLSQIIRIGMRPMDTQHLA